MQAKAEKTRDSLLQILDNLPDAVLMLEAGQLSYCNQKADTFFGVTLSPIADDVHTLISSQYLIMDKRCLHELKSKGVDEVAQHM